MGQRFLLDTNTIVHYFRHDIPEVGANWLISIILVERCVSVLTKIEFLGWQPPTIEEQEDAERFMDSCKILPLTNEIIDKTIEIRRTYKLKTPDAIIAATALVHNLTLISRNDKDFQRIKKLKYTNPFNL
jgi:predicted nucleic acid-binding protein